MNVNSVLKDHGVLNKKATTPVATVKMLERKQMSVSNFNSNFYTLLGSEDTLDLVRNSEIGANKRINFETLTMTDSPLGFTPTNIGLLTVFNNSYLVLNSTGTLEVYDLNYNLKKTLPLGINEGAVYMDTNSWMIPNYNMTEITFKVYSQNEYIYVLDRNFNFIYEKVKPYATSLSGVCKTNTGFVGFYNTGRSPVASRVVNMGFDGNSKVVTDSTVAYSGNVYNINKDVMLLLSYESNLDMYYAWNFSTNQVSSYPTKTSTISHTNVRQKRFINNSCIELNFYNGNNIQQIYYNKKNNTVKFISERIPNSNIGGSEKAAMSPESKIFYTIDVINSNSILDITKYKIII